MIFWVVRKIAYFWPKNRENPGVAGVTEIWRFLRFFALRAKENDSADTEPAKLYSI
jgi:hypothetical protein